jgi:prepilin-type N-terminal cleavage/methylation domain-containing protein
MFRNKNKGFALRNSKGFTLIELLVVIAIIGILSSVVLASLNTARQKGRDARRQADLRQIQLAAINIFDDASTYAVAETTCADGTTAGPASCMDDANANVQTYFPSGAPNDPSYTTGQYLSYGDADSFCVSVDLEQNTGFACDADQCRITTNDTPTCTNADTSAASL